MQRSERLLAAALATLACAQALGDPLAEPQMAGPLAANSAASSIEAGPLGKVYATGALSGLALAQTNPAPGDRGEHLDLGNAQLIVQKPEGLLQFYAQAGVYSIPVIGIPYSHATQNTRDLYGPLPVAYATLAPEGGFSIRAGKLQTLIGPEPTFTFQNMNIQRGLLWNQEPAVSRGVQADYAAGPLAFSLSVNDGFYSNRYSWLVGAATWTIDRANSLGIVASGNTRSTSTSSVATPVAFNNSQIYNLVYTHTDGPWKVAGYLQLLNVPGNAALGFPQGARSYGGALLASYRLSGEWSVAGRIELVGSTGSAASGAPDLLYGPGSSAWTVTLTPTYQAGRYFLRAEPSVTQAAHPAPGRAFGSDGNSKTQARLLVETGLLF
jgi:hypothetical protein